MSFHGETAKYYSRYRRGYPPAVVGALVTRLALSDRDIVLDLGCGTGLLTIPLAARVGAVAGMDPEPAMLAIARRAAAEASVTNAPSGFSAGTPTWPHAARCLAGAGSRR